MNRKTKDRYRGLGERKYNKKGISYCLMRNPCDKILIPYVEKIENKTVLEVGIGFGYYTKMYMQNEKNKIIGADMNPCLGKNLGIPIVKVKANELNKNIQGKYDRILSFFMTEYLSYTELENFIDQGINLLNKNGIFATTIIVRRGFGFLYTKMARLKGIEKNAYSIKEIKKIIESRNCKIRITPIYSICNIPFAILLEMKRGSCEKEKIIS